MLAVAEDANLNELRKLGRASGRLAVGRRTSSQLVEELSL
jgi:hypothetical protein